MDRLARWVHVRPLACRAGCVCGGRFMEVLGRSLAFSTWSEPVPSLD